MSKQLFEDGRVDGAAEKVDKPPRPLEHGEKRDGKTITLPSGKTVFVARRKGRHTVAAQRLMNQDQEMYFPALMHLLVEFDGRQLPMEDYLDMDGEDFDELMMAISGNSTTPSKT